MLDQFGRNWTKAINLIVVGFFEHLAFLLHITKDLEFLTEVVNFGVVVRAEDLVVHVRALH